MDIDYLPPFQAEGKLEEFPLPRLIATLREAKRTGKLYLEVEGVTNWIFFDEGYPAGIHSPQSRDYLGSILREKGLIDENTYNQSLMGMAKTKRRLGEILLETGSINQRQLRDVLCLQLNRKVNRLFSVKTGLFRFVADEAPPPYMELIRVNPYALIFNGIKNNYQVEEIEKALSVLEEKSYKVSSRFTQRKDLFEFTPEDLADAKLLLDYRQPQDFYFQAKGGTEAAMMLVLALMYCGMLELGKADLAVPISKTPAAPHPAEPPPTELSQKINDKFEQIKTTDLWGVLEIEKGADADRIKKAFLSLAKVYHPDSVAHTENSELIRRMHNIFAKINEAHAILIDPKRRTEYQKDAAWGSQGATRRPEEAKTQFQKALVFLKKRDYQKAADCIRWALELDPNNGDCQAHRVWIDYLRSESGTEPQRAQKAREEMQKVAQSNPGSFHAVRFLSLLFRKLDDQDHYQHYLEKAHSLRPSDIEVAREVRLAGLRKEKEGSPSHLSGPKSKK